ncbi:MAG: S9 family peptidase [Pseudomonadota bacterium]
MRTAFLAALHALALPVAISLAATPALAQQTIQVPPLEYYGDLPAVEEAILSPSGNFTALLTTVRGQRAILVLDKTGAPVKQLVVGDAKVRGIYWAGEQAILLLRTETGKLPDQYLRRKVEWWRGNVIPLDDAQPVVSIFAGQPSIANAVAGFYGIREVEGRWKGFFGGFRRGTASGVRNTLLDDAAALFEVDLLSGETKLADYAPDRPTIRDWLVAADGTIGARLDINVRTGDWNIRNANSKTVARGREARGQVDLKGFGSDGESIIYSLYNEAEQDFGYLEASEQAKEPRAVWDDITLSEIIVDPLSDTVLGVQGIDRQYRLTDESNQARLQAVYDAFRKRKGIGINVFDFTPDLATLIVATSGNYDSGTWFRVDSASNARAIVGLERPAIQGRAIGKVSRVDYTAQDGLEMDGILTLPPGREAKDLPLILLPHGGPASYDTLGFDWWAQGFASRGYAVFQPNFRGSTGRGAAFTEAGNGEWGRKMQTDKSDGVTALAEKGIVDPKRVCIVGASYGGYAALAGVTLQNGIYRCAVSVNGVANVEDQMLYTSPDTRNLLSRSMRTMFGERTDLDSISPTKFAKQADAPVLLIHGKDDTVVPYAQAVQMQDALEDAGKPVELVTLDGEDHFLSQPATRKEMLKSAVAFVEEHNPAD